MSFVIPVRNDAQRLQRCLASIFANGYQRSLFEVTVVDNGSTDDTAAVAASCGATVTRCPSGSVASLRNHGAARSRGTILAFVDSDHAIDGNWIATAVEVLALPGVAATGAPCLPDPGANWVQHQYDAFRVRSEQRAEVDWLGSGNLAVTRAAFERIGGFDAALTACEDVDLCNRLRQAGYRIVADPSLRNVHYGDPKTLKALFFGELWRGRDNIKVTFRGPKTFRHLRSALLPIVMLLALGAGLLLLLANRPIAALVCWSAALAPAILRAALMVGRQLKPTPLAALQALLVALVFDMARALALLMRGSHRHRRSM